MAKSLGFGPNGRADFYLLQKFRSAEVNIIYYVFDILVHDGRDLTRLPEDLWQEVQKAKKDGKPLLLAFHGPS